MNDHDLCNDFPKTIDINKLAMRHDIRIIVEPTTLPAAIEAESRIKQEDAAHRRRKDWLLFRAGIFAWIIFALLCIGLVLTASDGSERNWALATLTAMVTGLLGYLSGRRQPVA